jgi:hypothetical protein
VKNRVVILSIFCALLLGVSNVYGQVTFEATIQNQFVSGTDLYFDIYLQRTGSNDLYLGNAQFILTFNSSAFSSPTFGLYPNDWTYLNLTSSNGSSCGLFYYTVLSTNLTGNQLQISLDQVSFSSQSDFDSRIAKIDNQANTYRVGRYKISGISDQSANMNLQWVSSSSVDPHSKAYTLDPSTWVSSEAAGTWTNPPDLPLPIELTSFTASVVRDNDVEVTWKTVSETNNYGFEVSRKRGEAGEWTKVGFIDGHGTTLAPQSYSYTDRSVSFGKYYYQIKQIDLDGKSEAYPEMAVTVGVADKYVLAQNYPNPFNPTTVIEFAVAKKGYATVKLYNVLGQEVAKLFEGNAEAGEINTIRFNASSLGSGLYFYRLISGSFVDTKKLILLR